MLAVIVIPSLEYATHPVYDATPPQIHGDTQYDEAVVVVVAVVVVSKIVNIQMTSICQPILFFKHSNAFHKF